MNIKLTDREKIRINDAEDIFGIMQRILLRDNKIDQEKEHFWIIGINQGGYILYIELISLGSTKNVIVEPMNVFRVAILKGATRIIAVHNHPGGVMKPSDDDENLTDRLIQVGKIINIEMVDHLIISTSSYISFTQMGLMKKLSKSINYVPTFQIIESIRKEEKQVRKEVQKELKEIQQKLYNAVYYLLEKDLSIEQIALILDITPKKVEQISKKKKANK